MGSVQAMQADSRRTLGRQKGSSPTAVPAVMVAKVEMEEDIHPTDQATPAQVNQEEEDPQAHQQGIQCNLPTTDLAAFGRLTSTLAHGIQVIGLFASTYRRT